MLHSNEKAASQLMDGLQNNSLPPSEKTSVSKWNTFLVKEIKNINLIIKEVKLRHRLGHLIIFYLCMIIYTTDYFYIRII